MTSLTQEQGIFKGELDFLLIRRRTADAYLQMMLDETRSGTGTSERLVALINESQEHRYRFSVDAMDFIKKWGDRICLKEETE